MFLPIKPIIDRRPRRDGTSVITIQYCYSSDRRTLLFTGLAVPPRYWNKICCEYRRSCLGIFQQGIAIEKIEPGLFFERTEDLSERKVRADDRNLLGKSRQANE